MKTNLTPSEQFRVLWEFVLKQSPEVEAHGSDELLPDQLAALVELASGKADHKARLELIPLLRSNRKALSFLGEQIKLRRPRQRKSPPIGLNTSCSQEF